MALAALRRRLPAGLGALDAVARLLSERAFATADLPDPGNRLQHGVFTPVTGDLWRQHFRWTAETLAAAAPQVDFPPRAPRRFEVSYPFTTDSALREFYRDPWGGVRVGRLLEDLDSMAGFLAFEHCDDADAATRPAALVTAAVDAIRFGRGAEPSLAHDLTLGGRVVWTGATSLDVEMELRAAGGGGDGGAAGAPPPPHARALFTFAARDALTGAAHRVRPLEPRSPEERARFVERGAVAAARRAERAAAAAAAAAGDGRARGPPGAAAWAAARLAEAGAARELPALADPAALLSPETALENVFTAQPQERNLSGRIFGGHLMRRAYELADSAAHLFSAARPRALAAGEATFARPVEVGDLLRFRAEVLDASAAPGAPGRGRIHVRVAARVTRAEARRVDVTNTVDFFFEVTLRPALGGGFLPPRRVLPGDEAAALAQAEYYCGAGGAARLAALLGDDGA